MFIGESGPVTIPDDFVEESVEATVTTSAAPETSAPAEQPHTATAAPAQGLWKQVLERLRVAQTGDYLHGGRPTCPRARDYTFTCTLSSLYALLGLIL